MNTGAASPGEITHCFVLKGHDLVWAMLEGARCPASGALLSSKDIENRHVRLAPGWYGVILSKSTTGLTRTRYQETRDRLPGMHMPPWNWHGLEKYMGCVVGVVKISHSLPPELCKESVWATGPVCNVISHAGWMAAQIPCRGNLGACRIDDAEALRRVRVCAHIAWTDGKVSETGAHTRFPNCDPSVWLARNKKRRRGDDDSC